MNIKKRLVYEHSCKVLSVNSVFQFDGRHLPEEEIVFRDNRKVPAGPNADWGAAFRNENVITAVPLRTWVVLYTRRDSQRANDFISLMLKLCPGMGIECQAPTRFELKDDRVETYIRALREHINPRVKCSNLCILHVSLLYMGFLEQESCRGISHFLCQHIFQV